MNAETFWRLRNQKRKEFVDKHYPWAKKQLIKAMNYFIKNPTETIGHIFFPKKSNSSEMEELVELLRKVNKEEFPGFNFKIDNASSDAVRCGYIYIHLCKQKRAE